MKKMLIFPASHSYIGYIELLYSLKSMQLQGLLDDILVICNKEFYRQFHPPCSNYILDDFHCVDKLIEKVLTWKQEREISFQGILAIDDEEQFQVSKRIADYFDIAFYDDITLEAASDKYAMKKSFQRNGVPTSKFALISELDDVTVQDIGFPNVLKIVAGTGSEFIFLNNSKEDLKRNFAHLKENAHRAKHDTRFRRTVVHAGDETITLYPRREFLLEEYVKGQEYSCDFVKQNNIIQVIRVVKKLKGPYVGYFGGYCLLNKQSIERSGINLANLTDICRRVADSLSIAEGVCMVDFEFDGGIKVLETSIRPGLSTFIPLMHELYGYTSLSIMARLKMGQRIKVDIPEEEGMVVHIWADRPGIITSFELSNLSGLGGKAEVIGAYQYASVGDRITDSETNHYGLLVGYVLLRNVHTECLTELANEINYRLKPKVQPAAA